MSLPYLDTAQIREVDRIMVDEYGIPLIQMMENAGRNLAHLTRERLLAGAPVGKRIAVLAGPGDNGGRSPVSTPVFTPLTLACGIGTAEILLFVVDVTGFAGGDESEACQRCTGTAGSLMHPPEYAPSSGLRRCGGIPGSRSAATVVVRAHP